MSVETLRHEAGGDPVGEGEEPVDRGDERLAGHERSEGRGAVETRHAPGGDEPVPAARTRDQHAAFLERLADRGDLERCERVDAGAQRRGQLGVRRLHPAARKDQRAGGEVDLMMAHDHEGLEARRSVPQEQDGRGGSGRRSFGHSPPRSLSLSRKRWILPVAVFGSSAMNSISRGYL